jgi:hypothetical protein
MPIVTMREIADVLVYFLHPDPHLGLVGINVEGVVK